VAPIPAERCIAGRDLTEPRLSPGGHHLGWAESEAGVAGLVVLHADGSRSALATAPALRPGRGLGGGAWCFTPDGTAVVYVGADGNLWRQALDSGAPAPLTAHGPERSASGPQVSPDGRHVVYVIEQAEVWLVEIASGTTRRIDPGTADFCLDPHVGRAGTVRWQVWNVPDMPWDRSRVQMVSLATGECSEPAVDGAVQQPRELPDGTPVWVRDDTGWPNVWVGDAPLVGGTGEQCEHAGPTWGGGQRSYAWSPDGSAIAFTRNERGFGRLCVADQATGMVREIARGVHGGLSWEGDRLAAIRTGARTPTQVVEYDTRTWERLVHAQGPSPDWSQAELEEPTPVEVAVGDGTTLHARLYAADAPDGRLIVWLHGGPTDQWQVTFMPRLAYWRSRGWSVLVPDHRGSTGHGRAYQQALRGRWGDLDVDDTLTLIRAAHRAGWGAPAGTVVIGGSAGGFTALGALAREPECCAAAVLLYPVTDLVDMAERSHRFERHYTDSLVGPLHDALAEYRRRSPVWHTDRLTATPMLLLHGDVDPVVPVEQSRVLAERINAAGGRVELHVYEGEGHGFRQAANQLDEYRRIGDFLDRHLPIASQT
jgi:dipeptidyl aminopeptidase/acylaminoacyl peptidase